jgi:hypothetical protein
MNSGLSSYQYQADETIAANAFDGWWRWPLIPIAATFAAVVGSALFSFAYWIGLKIIGGFHEDGWFYLYILPALSSGVSGYLWCYSAAYVAPRGKLLVSVVMATVLAMLVVLVIVAHFSAPELFSTHPVMMTFSSIAAFLGAILATMQVAEEEEAVGHTPRTTTRHPRQSAMEQEVDPAPEDESEMLEQTDVLHQKLLGLEEEEAAPLVDDERTSPQNGSSSFDTPASEQTIDGMEWCDVCTYNVAPDDDHRCPDCQWPL